MNVEKRTQKCIHCGAGTDEPCRDMPKIGVCWETGEVVAMPFDSAKDEPDEIK